MFSFLLASMLALPTPASTTSPSSQPLPLKDSRFHYAVQAATSTAAAVLLITPTNGRATPQQITLASLAAQEPVGNIVVRDVNFDGQADLMLTTAEGNVNRQYAYWLYDTSTRRFVLNQAMSQALGGYSVKFDAAKRQIVTASRFSCCEHQIRTYAFQQGNLKLLATKTDKVATPATKQAQRTAQ